MRPQPWFLCRRWQRLRSCRWLRGPGNGGDGSNQSASANNDAGGDNPAILNDSTTYASGDVQNYENAQGAAREYLEALGTSGSPDFREMAFSIDKVSVTAKSRALKTGTRFEPKPRP